MGNSGSLWRKIHCKLHRNTEIRVLMLGLNDAGKTTILSKLKHGNSVTTNPTVGFNVETITYKGMKFTTWDVSGKSGARSLWHYYYPNMDVLILVVDSNDRERMDECRNELSKLMCEAELTDCCLLIMANKQDLPNAMSRQEITEKLDLKKLPPARPWYIQDTCAISGEGLYEGLSWVKNQVSTRSSVRTGISQRTADVEDRNKLHSSCFSFSNYLARSNHAVNESDKLELL